MTTTQAIDLYFGQSLDNRPLFVNLCKSSHVFILGEGRAGMPSMLRKLMDQFQLIPYSHIILADISLVNFADYKLRADDLKTNSVEQTELAIEWLLRLVRFRANLLELRDDFTPELLVISEATQLHLTESPTTLAAVQEILEFGGRTSVFVVVSANTIARDIFENLAYDFGVRVLLGRTDAPTFEAIFGEPIRGDSLTTGARGVGQLQLKGAEPTKFTV